MKVLNTSDVSKTTIQLYFTDWSGGSDKAYFAHLTPLGNGNWSVSADYGRRGAIANNTVKTPQEGVGREVAEKIFDKLICDKVKKGYTEAISGRYASEEEKTETIENLRFRYQMKYVKKVDQVLDKLTAPSVAVKLKVL